MPVVSFCGGIFCRVEEASRETARRLTLPHFTDRELAQKAVALGPLPEGKLLAAMHEQPGSLAGFTKLRPRALPQLGLAMAQLLEEGELVFRGLGSHLIPQGITHVLSVCLTAAEPFRLAQAAQEEGLDPRRAREMLRRSELAGRSWCDFLDPPGAWEAHQFDMMLPVDKKEMTSILDLIQEAALSPPLRPTPASREAVGDLALCARVQASLCKHGFFHPEFRVLACRGGVTIEINKKVLRLAKLESDLKRAAGEGTGAMAVDTKVGPGFHQSDVYRQSSFVLPSKVLLVDDEREFVETLSERLQLREVGASVVYDGEQALAAIAKEEPEVVVLDLRMPGVDGLEVLERIKTSYPAVKVIVLTGHGSARDRDQCLKLGAFAFLQKPVELEELAEVMRQAMAENS